MFGLRVCVPAASAASEAPAVTATALLRKLRRAILIEQSRPIFKSRNPVMSLNQNHSTSCMIANPGPAAQSSKASRAECRISREYNSSGTAGRYEGGLIVPRSIALGTFLDARRTGGPSALRPKKKTCNGGSNMFNSQVDFPGRLHAAAVPQACTNRLRHWEGPEH